jgi:hypothetical protein
MFPGETDFVGDSKLYNSISSSNFSWLNGLFSSASFFDLRNELRAVFYCSLIMFFFVDDGISSPGALLLCLETMECVITG